MSFAIDVNVLLYASDHGSPHQARAARFLEGCISGDQVFYVAWTTVLSYLRIATHPAIFGRPLSPSEAMRNVETILGSPRVRMLSEEDGFWGIYRELADTTHARGNFVPDVHLAALLRQHGIRSLYTRDRDFAKFGFLDVRDPF
jgi:toxin-antitoxin system PIN domain toxin